MHRGRLMRRIRPEREPNKSTCSEHIENTRPSTPVLAIHHHGATSKRTREGKANNLAHVHARHDERNHESFLTQRYPNWEEMEHSGKSGTLEEANNDTNKQSHAVGTAACHRHQQGQSGRNQHTEAEYPLRTVQLTESRRWDLADGVSPVEGRLKCCVETQL